MELLLNEDKLKIDLSSRLAANPNLVLRIEDDDCALLFDPDNGRVQMLNGTAVAVWQRFDGKQSLQEIIESLRESYDGIDDLAVRNILATVERLSALGAVGVWERA
jgi:hypothetical protein